MLANLWYTYLRWKYKGTQLLSSELSLIIKTIHQYDSCQLLVFGLGHDTPLWIDVNKAGRTVFLENDRGWHEKVTKEYPWANAHLVDYPHNITQWESLIDQPERLEINLPEEVKETHWDVILVDAPAGWKMVEQMPGRMSSIYMASRLAGEDTKIFVHDCERPLEKAYTDSYLKEENLLAAIRGRALLKMYQGQEKDEQTDNMSVPHKR